MTRPTFTAELDASSLRALGRALEAAADKAEEGIAVAVRGSAEAVGALERSLAPRRTGALVASIDVKVAGDGKRAAIGPDGKEAWYAYLVEWGTSTRPATPFATPAAERARVDFPRAVIDEVRRRIR